MRLADLKLFAKALRRQMGFRRYIYFGRSYAQFLGEYRKFQKMDAAAELPSLEADLYPIMDQKTATMRYDPHYTYHCAWACRVLAATKPENHIDISSSIAFVTMASAWMPIEHYDLRTPEITLPGLTVGTADLTNLKFKTDSVRSLSCLHVLEHVGLGRYGDALDPNGDCKAAGELARVLAPAGQLLMVVPVGRPRVNFNAHRVYSYEHVLKLFSGLSLDSVSLICDNHKTGIIDNPPIELISKQEWGCGCFVFKKPVRNQ